MTRDEISDLIGADKLFLLEAHGLAVVPREPTADMIDAGLKYRMNTTLGINNPWSVDTTSLYRAMISAGGVKP